MEEIKIDDKAIERLKRMIIIQENMNLKTRTLSDQQMVRRKHNVTSIDKIGKLPPVS